MNIQSLFDLPSDLEVVGCEVAEQGITLTLLSSQPTPRCPLCGTPARRLHSQYRRQLSDLPCAGQRVRLLLQVRKCFCDAPTCGRTIFTERLAPFIQPWARVTTRLCEATQVLGRATSGRLGARVGQRLGMPTSWMTVLRRLMALPTPPVERVTHVGIDDFSFRRGRTFGTILVDLQSHVVLDLLPDRTADTAAAWLAAHREIELVSRDRSSDYARAAARGAPQARQCADRFHLLKNLGEALQGVLAQHLAAQRTTQAQQARATPLATQPAKGSPGRVKRAERQARYQHVVALRKQGLSHEAIAGQVGRSRATVSRWVRQARVAHRPGRSRTRVLDPYLPYVRQRWQAGCHNIAQLHRELVARGYPYTYRSVYASLVRLLPEGKKHARRADALAAVSLSARQASFLFLRRPEQLKAEEQATLLTLRHLHPELEVAYDLGQQVARLLRTRTGEQLDDWLAHVRVSPLRELQDFGASLERDHAAVVAGLTLAHSNGVVEGHVNKLKLLKRQMYGRANFPLVRQRVLHAV